jgi:hypothetical protein
MVRLGNQQEKQMKGNGTATKVTGIGPEATNGAKEVVEFSQPFIVDVRIEGTARAG